MEVEDVRLIVGQLTDELSQVRTMLVEGRRRAAAISKVVAGYVEMFPELGQLVEEGSLLIRPERAAEPETPKGAEAVRIVLQSRPTYWWYISELVDELRGRGWLPESDNPANAVRTACERLLNTDGSDVHKGRGSSGKIAYSYRPDEEPWDGSVVYINDTPPGPTYADEEPF